MVFIATRNTLDEVKTVASKLQKWDQDIFEAYMMADEVIGNIKSVRKNIDSDFQVWYKQILDLNEKLGIVEASPRKTSIQRNRSNILSCSPIDHYKKSVAIPLLDSLIIQMRDRFINEDRHARHLLHLVPSIIVNNTLELSKATEGMMFWENDLPFPKSLGNELRIWQIMRQSAEKELPSNLLLALGTCDGDAFPNIFFSLHAPYQSVVRKLSGPFRSRNGSRRAPDQRCVKSAFPISLLLRCITLRESR